MTDTAPPGHPGCAGPGPAPSTTALRHWIAALALAADVDSPRARAAVVLLAARDAGLNIDRLARLTGFPRHFVAACARRLHDNAVWESGETHYPWSGAEDPAFWSDVGVALGTLQRRTDERGQPVWTRPGEWVGSYEPGAHGPAEEQALELRPAGSGEVPWPRTGGAVTPSPHSRRSPALAGAAADPHSEGARVPPEPLAPSAAPGATELFPGASWLGRARHEPGT